MQLLAVLALAAQTAGGPAYSVELRGEELMKALQSGGYTILLRHARTDWSFKEEVGSVPVERSAQRNLSADGVRDAALMGVVLKRYRIPIGEIVASPMFRARETAEYAAGTPTVSMALRVFPTTDETAALVAAAPKPGTNRLLVTHHFVIEKLVPGIKPGDVGESEAAVVRCTPAIQLPASTTAISSGEPTDDFLTSLPEATRTSRTASVDLAPPCRPTLGRLVAPPCTTTSMNGDRRLVDVRSRVDDSARTGTDGSGWTV
jgi:phosphohistidine phosphatase SixA